MYSHSHPGYQQRGVALRPAGSSAGPGGRKGASSPPTAFLYNGRIAAVLISSLFTILSSNTIASGALVGGCMVAYVLDAMGYREGSFFAVWACLVTSNVGLSWDIMVEGAGVGLMGSGDSLGMLGVLGVGARLVVNSGVLFLAGSWATLQYKWVQNQYPAVVNAFEKILLTAALPVGGSVLFWGLILKNGMDSAAYLGAALLCVMYGFFARPLPPSFPPQTGRSSSPRIIQRKLDAALQFFFVLAAPTLTYVAAHNETISSFLHLWSIVLLFFAPLLYMSAVPKGLWWLGESAASSAMKRFLVLVSLAGVLAGIEGRIVFHSFGQYIKIAPPFSYIAITVAMYGLASIVLLHLSGMMGDQMALVLLGPILMVSTAIGCLVVGVPIWVLPAPLVSAAGVAMYCESRSSRDYMLIMLGALFTAAWFLYHHFGFLDVLLDGMHLRTVCGLVFLAIVPALAIPGLVLSGTNEKSTIRVTGVLMTIQASIIAVLEEHLYAGDYLEVTFDVHPMFPASLVVATSALGMYLTRRMQESSKIGIKAAFVVECIYGAKLSMIFVPETRLAIPVIAYALTSLHPLFLGAHSTSMGNKTSYMVRKADITAPSAVLMALAVLMAVVASRFAVFDALHILLNRKPSESVAAGTLLVASAVGWIPMVATYFGTAKASSLPKRAVVLVGSLGLLLILLRPPLPIKGGAECPKLPLALCPRLWDASHTPEHEQDDVAVYGDGLRRREHWPLWFVVAASFSGILASTSSIRLNAMFAPIRLIQGGMAGLLVGGYMALEFFPGMLLVQVVAAASCVTVSFIIVFLSVPSKGSAILLPLFGLAWLAVLPLALFVLELSSLPPLPPDMVRLHPDMANGIELDHLRRSTTRLYLVSSVAAQALIISFAGKLRLSSAQKSKGSSSASPMLGAAADAAYIDKAADFLGGYVSSSVNSMTVGGLAGVNYQKIKAVGMSYLPEAMNFVTMLCYGLCLWVNRSLNGEHMPAMTLVLSTILLLLSQDSLLLRRLTDRRRYFPPYASAACVLCWVAIADVLGFVASGNAGSAGGFSLPSISSLDPDLELIGVNFVPIMLCFPSITEMMRYLWSKESARAKVWLSMLTGLAAASVISVSDDVEESVKTLVGVSVVSAIVLGANEGERKRRGERVL